MAPTRAAFPVALLASLAVLLGAPRAHAEDPAPAAADEDRVVAAYLEGMNIRMRAKADEARLYDALGEKEKALAVLKEIGEGMKQGDVMVARLLARRTDARPDPAAGTDSSLAAAKPPPPRVNPDMPDRAVVVAACQFLVRAQAKDGLLDPSAARAEGDPAPQPGHEVAVTAAAVMAWLDAAEFLARDASEQEAMLARTVEAAADRAAEALVAAQSKAGRFAADLDDHLLATWALAAARSRLGRTAWDRPLDDALSLVIAAQGEDGWWNADDGDRDASALRTAFAFAALQEMAPLPLTKGRVEEFESAMQRPLWRALLIPADTIATGRLSGVVARSLLVRRSLSLGTLRRNTKYRLEADPTVPLLGETPARRLASLETAFWSRFDPADGTRVPPGAVPLVLGTAYAWGGTTADWIRWRERVLLPAVASRVQEGPAAGSWSPVGDPRGERYGRAATTAFHLLAALHPAVPIHPPRGQ
jgi:hypothetical protein